MEHGTVVTKKAHLRPGKAHTTCLKSRCSTSHNMTYCPGRRGGAGRGWHRGRQTRGTRSLPTVTSGGESHGHHRLAAPIRMSCRGYGALGGGWLLPSVREVPCVPTSPAPGPGQALWGDALQCDRRGLKARVHPQSEAQALKTGRPVTSCAAHVCETRLRRRLHVAARTFTTSQSDPCAPGMPPAYSFPSIALPARARWPSSQLSGPR